jgi:tRNA pseudouridine32 synthase/23S rRNA pseudouridine746 synthase
MPTTAQKFEKHININNSGETALDVLATECTLSRQQLKQAMQKGCVWLTHAKYTQRIRRAKKILAVGDELHIYYNSDVLSQQPLPAQIISDCGAYSVWYKPYGMYSQGSKWGDHCTINRFIEQQTERPAFIVHRLDRAATGLMLIAHKKTTAAQLSSLFEKRQLDKKYQAVVHGYFPEQVKLDRDIDNKSALSVAKLLSYNGVVDQSLVEVKIETGRKHQIRIHLSSAGFPIVGDRLHGISQDEQNLQLCSYYLKFACPIEHTDKEFTLSTDLMPDT